MNKILKNKFYGCEILRFMFHGFHQFHRASPDAKTYRAFSAFKFAICNLRFAFCHLKFALNFINFIKFICFLPFSFCLLPFISSAQVITAAQYTRKADEAFADKNFNAALEYYRIVLEDSPERTDLLYNAADAALETRHFAIANTYFDNLARTDKAKEYPALNYKRGEVKKDMEEYDLAISLFEKYAAENPTGEYSAAAKSEIETCEWAKTIVFADKKYEITHLDRGVNSPYIDAAPVFYDGTLFYTSGYVPDSIKSSAPVTGVYATSDLTKRGLPLPINSKVKGDNTASYALTTDKSTLFYTICTENENGSYHCAIYRRSKIGESDWGAPFKLDTSINKPGYTSTQPSVGYDSTRQSDVLFFASDKPGSKGGMDLWMANIDNTGSVSKPQNIDDLNTTKDEVTPFFHTSTQTLFFSTDGYKTLGGLDIYSSKIMAGELSEVSGKGAAAITENATLKSPNGSNSHWMKAEHGGYPMNSSYDDTYYSLSKAKAFFVSNRKGGICDDKERDCICNDIYSYNLKVDLKAETFLAGMSNKLDGVRLDLLDVEANALVGNQINATGNDFAFPLEFDKKYKIIARKKGFLPDSATVNTLNLNVSTTLYRPLELRPNAKLTVYVFDKLEKKPLNDATIILRDSKGKIVTQKVATGTNTLAFGDLLYGTKYFLNGELKSYQGDSNSVAIDAISVTPKFEYFDTLYLDPFGGLPFTLYFDNDEPVARSRDVGTIFTYGETYDRYIDNQPDYLKEVYATVPAEIAALKASQISSFFEDQVRYGDNRLLSFSSVLEKYIASGHALELVVQGYASPIAQKDYNKILSMRRVSSVINHFKSYNGGSLLNAMKSGQLRIRVEPFGAERASSAVSADGKQRDLSVYSIEAMRERKVEIVEINRIFLDKTIPYDPDVSMMDLFSLKNVGSLQAQLKALNARDISSSFNLQPQIEQNPSDLVRQAMAVTIVDNYTGKIVTSTKPIDVVDPNSKAVIGKARAKGGSFTYTVENGKEYVLKSTSLGYSDVSLSAPYSTDAPTGLIHDTLYLTPFAGLPLSLYFDNDKPNSANLNSYDKTYRDFYAKKSEFIRVYNKLMASSGASAASSSKEMDLFFESELKGGYNKLTGFCEVLKNYLQNGNNMEIILEGYASPLSDGEYNKRLSQRRIQSVRASLNQFQNGVLRKYLAQGKLKITEEVIGASANAFDARTDASVYSMDASLNRRVVIKDIILNGNKY